MNHWYAADSISTQHRQDLDREAAADALARAALTTGTEVRDTAAREHRLSVRTAAGWRRRFLLAMLGVARTAEGWLEARLALAEEPAR